MSYTGTDSVVGERQSITRRTAPSLFDKCKALLRKVMMAGMIMILGTTIPSLSSYEAN